MNPRPVDRVNPRSVARSDGQREWISLMLDHETGWNPHKSYGPFRSKSGARSFDRLAKRLAAVDYVIVERPLGRGGAGRYVIVHRDDWVIEDDVEPLWLEGLGGCVLGLPRGVARELITEHARSRPPYTDSRGRSAPPPLEACRAHNALHPPRYKKFLALQSDALDLLEGLVGSVDPAQARAGLDLDELAAVARRLAATGRTSGSGDGVG